MNNTNNFFKAHPVESNTTVLDDRTGAGERWEGGRGEAERNGFLCGGDLEDTLDMLTTVLRLYWHTRCIK